MSERSLSVVVAAWNAPDLLRTCLQSLASAASNASPSSVQVIVASARSKDRDAILDEFPQFTHVVVQDAPIVPRLRREGLARATGDAVAFIEDHATVSPDWARALIAAYDEGGTAAVGGPVAQGQTLSALDWGAYLFDYGRFGPPCVAGPVPALSGLNMSFSRAVLDSIPEVLADGVFEGPTFDALARRGIQPRLAPTATVYHFKHYSLRDTLVAVYYLGRGYAGRRVAAGRRTVRFVRAAGCALLPAVMVWRVLSVVLPKGRDTRRVLGSLGYLSLLALMWSTGECAGYVMGPGESDARWR